MNQIELNVRKSFAQVRKDIIEIKNQLLRLSESQRTIENSLAHTKKDGVNAAVVKTVKVVRPKTVKKSYIAAKEGKKFHIKECPYAQNIKPKALVKFKTKEAALNKGYKPCKCVK